MLEVKLKATSEDESEILHLQFEELEVESLKLYLDNCKRLENAQILKGKFPSIKNIEWTEKSGMNFDVSQFEYSHICELLHLARPMFLEREPASFKNTLSIFGKRAKKTSLAKHLKYLSNTYKFSDHQGYMQITIGDTPLFHDKTIKLWLNGVEYHQDSDKAKIIKELEASLSESSVRGVFVTQLYGRIKAIFMLSHLAKLIVDESKG